jgi:Tfp pilus assembly protein PilO
VQRGQQLMDREDSIRNKWKSMLQANLPDEVSLAESEAYQAFDRWATDGGISVQSLLPNWQDHTDEGYETLECRVTAVGNLASLGRFVYDLETDPIPVNLEECELAARDESGSQLTMTARITFLRLIAPKEGSQ